MEVGCGQCSKVRLLVKKLPGLDRTNKGGEEDRRARREFIFVIYVTLPLLFSFRL